MVERPTLSIITPVYNGAEFASRCYDNLLSQSFTNWEWIVVDDGSTDGTSEAFQGISDKRIRLIRYDKNRGRGHARNLAIKESAGDWIVIWDVDDLHFPDRLDTVESARIQGFDFFCSYAVVVNNEMGIKGTRGFSKPTGCLPRGFVHPTLALKRDIAEKVGYKITKGVGGIGEDAKLLWILSLKHIGLWYEDALTIYQEDREVNLTKAIDSNLAHLQTLKELKRENLISQDRNYIVTLTKYYIKLFVLNAMRVCPRLYLKSVNWRDYGQLGDSWKLSEEKVSFIEKLH